MRPHLLDSLYDKMLSRLGLAMLGLALLVNLVALLAVHSGVDKLDRARQDAIESRGVILELVGIKSLLLEAVSAERGYLYTDNPDYLLPLNNSAEQVSARIEKLRATVGDAPGAAEQLQKLQATANERIAELNRIVAIQQMGRRDEARAVVMTNGGRVLMAEFEATLTRLLGLQRTQRDGLLVKVDDIQLAIRWGFATILFINALLLLAGAMTIMRDISRKRAQIVLLDQHAAVLASEVAQRAEELRALSAHLIRVQEEERRNIARELHDELGGTLSAVKMDIVMGRDAAAKRSDEKSVARFQRALTAVDSAVQFVRRLIEDLRPTLLDNIGLEAALRVMVEQFSERASVRCEVSLPEGELDLTSAQSTALYRICQEALTNVMKYAKATSVRLTLTKAGGDWKLVLADDGVGLDATKQHRSISHGLLGMRERMVALGGTFDIRGPKGQGTTITATFPTAATVEESPA
ncbi:MAG: CHASE3 domain-containing protein [Usitatibacteraceae bacterium]